MEGLEARRLLSSVTAVLVRGTLTVRGTSGEDRILIDQSQDQPSKLEVNFYDVRTSQNHYLYFDGDAVHRIRLFAMGGNDALQLRNMPAPHLQVIVLNGGSGQDDSYDESTYTY